MVFGLIRIEIYMKNFKVIHYHTPTGTEYWACRYVSSEEKYKVRKERFSVRKYGAMAEEMARKWPIENHELIRDVKPRPSKKAVGVVPKNSWASLGDHTRLTVVGRLDDYVSEKSGNIYAVYNCKCSCGNFKEVKGVQLLKEVGGVRSCGCLRSERVSKSLTKHGGVGDLLYGVWCDMKSRCNSKNHTSYKIYGAKGIKVSSEWSSEYTTFRDWALGSGYKKGLTLDRKDGSKGYNPENCRWLTIQDQARNTLNPRSNTGHNGIRFCSDKRCHFIKVSWSIPADYVGKGSSKSFHIDFPINLEAPSATWRDAVNTRREILKTIDTMGFCYDQQILKLRDAKFPVDKYEEFLRSYDKTQ